MVNDSGAAPVDRRGRGGRTSRSPLQLSASEGGLHRCRVSAHPPCNALHALQLQLVAVQRCNDATRGSSRGTFSEGVAEVRRGEFATLAGTGGELAQHRKWLVCLVLRRRQGRVRHFATVPGKLANSRRNTPPRKSRSREERAGRGRAPLEGRGKPTGSLGDRRCQATHPDFFYRLPRLAPSEPAPDADAHRGVTGCRHLPILLLPVVSRCRGRGRKSARPLTPVIV
jgi:hypothetical protein